VKQAESSREDRPLDLSGWGEGGRRLKRMTPSEQAEQPRKASLLFAGETRAGLATGTAVHELFEAVEWADDADAAQIFTAWSSTHERAATEEIEEHFRIALAAEPIRQALSRATYSMESDVSVDVWRERSFETVMEGSWITGTFDRVTVVRDAAGIPRQAWILDYKTNQVGSEDELVETVEHYRPQLELYRAVLTRLLGLTPQQVVMQLAFTRLGRVETLTNL
jgi:ATP-dependent exoDNAse (exonuclease V) beta subunit